MRGRGLLLLVVVCSYLITNVLAEHHILEVVMFNHGHLIHSLNMYPKAILIYGL